MKIAFLGDISLNDDYIELYQKGINPFEEIGAYLKSFDYVIGNLECMAEGNEGENDLKVPRLRTTIETLNYLTDIGVNAVSLAHNHVYDHLRDGFDKTTAFLDKHQIAYWGASTHEKDVGTPLVIETNGVSVCVLTYVSKDTNPKLPVDAKVFPNWLEEDKVIKDIQNYKQKHTHVFLFLHWGGRLEGGCYPDWEQPKMARRFIDAGADLIVGNHSHTIQPYEKYKGKYIFYSLGNFCFSNLTFENEFTPISKRGTISFIVGIQFFKQNYMFESKYYKNKLVCFKNTPLYTYKHRVRNRFFQFMRKCKPIWYVYFFYYSYILPVLLFYQRKDIGFSQKNIRFFKYIQTKLLK